LALPAGQAAAATRPCKISAYVTDQDPNGTNIRLLPSSGGKILKIVPAGADAVVDITGYQHGWFRISGVQEVGDNDHTLFRGSGWMHRSVLALDVANEDPRLYAAPAKDSKVTAKLVADGSHVRLIGCTGDWAQVRFGSRTGWLSPGGQCSSPLTTCS
jgi:SH3-like domain-containing protein